MAPKLGNNSKLPKEQNMFANLTICRWHGVQNLIKTEEVRINFRIS